MSNDQLPEKSSTCGERWYIDPPNSKIIADPTVTQWSLSAMLIWMVCPLACFVMSNLWVDSFSRVQLSSWELFSIGFVTIGLSFFVVFLPLFWLFSASGIHFVSRILILLITSAFVFGLVFAPRFFGCLWASICLTSIFYQFRDFWPRWKHACTGSSLSSMSMLLSVGIYSFSMELWPTFELRKLREMRERYPIVDVSQRISRLIRPNVAPPDLSMEATLLQTNLTRKFDAILFDDWNHQESQLRLVHNRQFERFVRAPGFGGTRMNPRIIRYNPERLSAGDRLHPIDAHAFAYYDFANPSTLGLVTDDWKFYVGFKPHRIFNAPVSVQLSQQYVLEKLELVSILLHETPVVYETNDLPNMETITAGVIPFRELNQFESRSLEKIRDGRSIVFENQGETFRMLGALRAIDQCTDCHQVDTSQLLGAFSYEYRLKSQSDVR